MIQLSLIYSEIALSRFPELFPATLLPFRCLLRIKESS